MSSWRPGLAFWSGQAGLPDISIDSVKIVVILSVLCPLRIENCKFHGESGLPTREEG